MKHSETDLCKKPNFRCQRENRKTRGKPTEASLDWKPNAHKCRDQESNPELIGIKRGKIRYANLLPPGTLLILTLSVSNPTSFITR